MIPAIGPGLAERVKCPVSLLGEQLLEQIQCSRVVRLTEPEQGLLAYLGILVGSRHCDQCRNTLVARPLRKSEHRALTDFAINAVVDHYVLEIRCRDLAGSLPQPEHCLSPGAAWEIRIARDSYERRPDVGAVGNGGRKDRLLSHASPLRLRDGHEIIRCFTRW